MRTNDKAQENSRCWSCGERDKTINQIISEYSKIAQKELCKILKLDQRIKWYMQKPESVHENDINFSGVLRYKRIT